MKKKIFIVAAVIFSSQSYAQQTAQINPADSTTMDEVVITATKTQVKQSQTGKVVTVINQATLQRNVGKSLTEILNYQAGVFVNGANNSPGSNQDYYIRGAATSNTLILLDGVPVADPSSISSYFDLNNINPAQVERIEILKGAQSTLWGSDAVAGVINIITKKGSSNKISPSAMISYGSYNTFKANAGLDGSIKNFTYNLQYGYTNSNGFSSAHDSSGNKNFDKDGLVQNNFQANFGHRINKKTDVRYTSNFGRYNTDLDAGAFRDDKDYTNENSNFVNGLVFNYTGKKSTLHFVNTFINTKRIIEDDSASIGGFSTYARGKYKGSSFVSELYGQTKLSGKLTLLAGLQRMANKTSQYYLSLSSFGPFETALGDDSAKTTNYAGYTSLSLINYKNFNAEAGIRYNNHSVYGNNVTWSFNPSYNIDENTRVFVNLSSAYKVPSLYQLYSEYGNKDLQPEESINYEVGVQSLSNNKKNSLRLVAFKRDIKDVIVFYTDQNYVSQYINRDEQNDYGFEIENNFAIGKIGQWVTNLTYVDGDGETNNNKVKNLYRRPNFNFNSTLTLEPVKGLTLMPSFRFVGTRIRGEYDPGPAVMPQYYTLDFYLGYQVARQVRLFTDWRNITNQQFFDIPGYNSRLANFTIGLNAQL
jgi:vitamin B12 transporter